MIVKWYVGMLRVEGRGESAGGGVCRETVLRHATFTCRVPLTLQVGVGPDKRSALAEICIVNFDGEVVYHRYVKPQEKVTGEQMLCLRIALVPLAGGVLWRAVHFVHLLDVEDVASVNGAIVIVIASATNPVGS